MPLDFPASPVLDELYTFGGRTWKYNGSAWDLQPQALTTINATNDTTTTTLYPVMVGQTGINTTAKARSTATAFSFNASTGAIASGGNMTAWSTTTPGLGVGGIHFGSASATSNAGSSITFGARDASSGANAQAGIYINSDVTYGTRMYLATTDSYAAGSKVAISIDHLGAVTLSRSGLTASSGTISGNILASTVATGTAPLTVTSTTLVTNLNADLLDGLNTQTSGSAITANQVARSDANGYVYFNYINSNTANTENPTVSQVIVTNGSDSFYRKASIAHLTSAVQTNASGSWGISVTGSSASCTGNAATATNLSTNRGNWNTNGTISAVVGQLAWKNYGNGHTIFDASAGTSPDGGAVNNTDSQIAWSSTYPTLMGWNGANTYGVRVDRCRLADTASNADLLDSINSTSFARVDSTSTFTVITYFQSNLGTTLGALSNPPLQAYATGTNAAFMSFHRSGSYAVNFGLDSDNVLRIGGWSAPANRWQLDMSGNGTYAGTVTANSDIKLKENIEVINNALEKVSQIRGVTFTRNDQDDKEKRHAGVIAQEVEKVLPEVVMESADGIKSVAYGNLVGLLIEAIKEQQTQINNLNIELNILKSTK